MNSIFVPLQQKALRVCGLAAACVVAASALAAQAPRPTPRIKAEIANSELATLPGSVHPFAQLQNDAGRMPANTPLRGISLYFNRSAAQQADLQALLAAQQDPSSPQYHQWLTPDQFAARFGMAQSDIDQVQTWLQQQGFSVDSVARSRNMIRFSGTVGQVESAFSTQLRYYNVGGVRHFAPSTALSVPAAIAPVVAGIRNLNDFRPRPQHIKARGAFTSSQSGNVYFAPPDIATVYDIGPLTSGGVNGAGQTIAIAGQSAINVSDIENFESASNLPKKDPTLVLVPGTGDSQVLADGDEGESDIDVEWSGATAPGANIVFVYVGSTPQFGVYDSVAFAVDEKLANIISLSYDTCELDPGLTSADVTLLEGVFQQAAAQGQTVSVASGDQGSTACFVENPPQTGDPPLATQEALAVNYPASSAYVTSVGGTEITAADGIDPLTGAKGANYSTYWQGQGSSDIVPSALKYIPEVAWNDDAQGNGLSSSGGGVSIFVSRPSWQTGVPGIPSGTMRLVPDIALYSSPDLPGYLFCTSDNSDWFTGSTTAPPQQASCGSGTFRDTVSGGNYLTVAGGTSFAAPIFAGMVALINQKTNNPAGSGLVNKTLYQLAANSSTYSSAFNDIISGNNFCTAGSTYCASNGTTLGYQAGTGYDQVTGLGSVNLNALASAWPVNSSALPGTTTTVSASNSAPNTGQSVTFTVTVAPVSGSGTPTGTVNLSIDQAINSSEQLAGGTTTSVTLGSNGTATYTTSFSSAGIHEVIAQYAGDTNFAPSTGSASVTIATSSSGKGTIALGASPSTLTVSQGTSGTETVTVTPSGGYTGTVLVSMTTSNNNALGNLCYAFTTTTSTGQGSVAVSGTAAVTTTLTLDTNASDCSSATGGVKSGLHPMRTLLAAGSRSRNTPPKPAPNRLPAEAALAALLFAGFLGRYAPKFRAAAWVLVLAAAGLAMSACGSSTVTTTVTDPAKGTYTITLTGTDSTTSTITSTTMFTFTIN